MRRRDQLAKLRRLALRSGEAGPAQALELLLGLDDEKLWQLTLDGCGLKDGVPVLGSFFDGPKTTLAHRRAAWLTMVGAVPREAPMDASLRAPLALSFPEWRLDRWPDQPLPRFETVEVLVFDRCWLSALPRFALHLPDLRELLIERARLVEPLPAELWRPALHTVRVAHAWLDTFPVEAAAAENLERLSLEGNRITELPEDLASRFAHVALDLRANPLGPAARARLQAHSP